MIHARAAVQVGSCFETLVFGVDHRARPYGRPPDNETALLRKRATALHRRFAVEAVRRTHALRHWPEPVLFPRVGHCIVALALLLPAAQHAWLLLRLSKRSSSRSMPVL